MGILFSICWNYAHCHNCDTIANFRCSVKLKDNRYPNQLRNYYRSTIMDDENYVHQFVACEKCIDSSVFSLFTYHPNGWKEDIKFYIEYEEAKI